MPKPSLREKLLDAGFHLMWKTGYAATGVRDIVAEAGSHQVAPGQSRLGRRNRHFFANLANDLDKESGAVS